MGIKGFKAMDKDLTCRGYKFKVGKTFETGKIVMCSEGFHFCENPFDVYNYYPKSSDTVVCEVEAIGEVLKEGDKSVTNKLKIVKQLSEKELLDLWINRTNSGNRNSGDWNSGDGNSGYFNTTVPVYMFNKPTNIAYTKEFENRVRSLKVKPIVEWVPESFMTDKEKTDFPSHKTTGGFIRNTDRHDWTQLTEDDKTFIKSLPNFDDEVFKQISGVSLSDDVEVTVNGQVKVISRAKAKELGLID